MIRPGRELAIGSAWMVGMRWAIRGVGLMSTIILARLLAPDDFGVIAMAMVAVAILQSFAQSGVDLALLRAEAPHRGHYDAAWTLEIVQGVMLAAALFFSAPLVSGHFGDPRVDNVIQALAVAPLVGGFQNIGVVDFRRNLDFRREFQFGVYKKLATFLVTISAAVLMGNYWALVVGQVAGRCVEVAVSYRMSGFRPRWSLEHVGEIWSFSRWLILSRFTMLLNRQFDRWLVGSIGGAAVMGNYFVAQDFASSPSDEVVAPMSRAAFPVYSRLQSNPAALADALQRMLSSVTAITFATGLGIAAVASDFVHVVLGDKWAGAIPFMPWLGLFAAVYGVARTLDSFLVATGGERVSSLLSLAFAVGLIPVLWYVGELGSIEGIAAAKACTVVVLVLLLCYFVVRRSHITLAVLWSAVWPPMVAAAAMFLSVKSVQFRFPQEIHLLGLVRDVAVGSMVYVAASGLLWVARGRPAGVETDLISEIRRRFRRDER
jgi:O-antigen/teichoic acid export membrane protein